MLRDIKKHKVIAVANISTNIPMISIIMIVLRINVKRNKQFYNLLRLKAKIIDINL